MVEFENLTYGVSQKERDEIYFNKGQEFTGISCMIHACTIELLKSTNEDLKTIFAMGENAYRKALEMQKKHEIDKKWLLSHKTAYKEFRLVAQDKNLLFK